MLGGLLVYENGKFQVRENFIDGELDGLWEKFHDNGQLRYRVNYIEGKREGLQEFFDEDGNLTKTETYRNGELIEENLNP